MSRAIGGEGGSLVLLAYNETEKKKCEPTFLDGEAARALISAMELREAVKKAEMAKASETAKAAGRPASASKDKKVPKSKLVNAQGGSRLSPKVRAEVRHECEIAFLAKELLVRMLCDPRCAPKRAPRGGYAAAF